MTCCCGIPGPVWQSEANWTFMTLFFQDQGERVSQIFSLQPSQAVKEIAAGSLSPHYTSSQWNAAFSLPGGTGRQVEAGAHGLLCMVTLLWKPGDCAHGNHSNSPLPRPTYSWFKVSVVLILIFVTVLWAFHSPSHSFNWVPATLFLPSWK